MIITSWNTIFLKHVRWVVKKKKIRLKINIWYFHMNLNKTSYMLLNNIWKISDDQRGLIFRDVINSYFYLSIYKEKNYGLSLIVFKLGYRIKTQKIKIYYCFLSILMYICVLFNCFGVFIFLTLSQLNMHLFSCSIELIMAIIKY